MQSFDDFTLPKPILEGLTRMGFPNPTPIQAKAIPVALEPGRDILGTAQTGTGKTGAFVIPICAKLLTNQKDSVLVLTPTRELAVQVMGVFHKLLPKDTHVRTALLIGGAPLGRQFRELKRSPRVIVGTPGRIYDHIDNHGTFKVGKVTLLVLDEMDLMLDRGFDVQVAAIMKGMHGLEQRLMFSATLSPRMEGLAKKYLQNPTRLRVGETRVPHENITQEMVVVAPNEKYVPLLAQLEKHKGTVVVFVRTRKSADHLMARLNRDNYSVVTIHGHLRQSKRDRVLRSLREKKARIVVATDIMARGIDVPHIELIINYDLPQSSQDYIHRIGRTARGSEKKGHAVSFVPQGERKKWTAIQGRLDGTKKEGSGEFQYKRERTGKRRRPERRGFAGNGGNRKRNVRSKSRRQD